MKAEMTNREMLELAAKAAGIELVWGRLRWGHRDDPCSALGFFQLTDDRRNYVNEKQFWNPLTNDADALRLAVKLRLEPRFLDLDHPAGPPRITFHNIAGLVELAGNDLMAATRRAIVRAAAEIGRAEK